MEFEGQSFVPAGADQRTYSLIIDDGTLKRLTELLEATGWQFEWEVFQIEFWGTLSWIGGGCGHLGGFGGNACVVEIVKVEFLNAERQEKIRPRSIRERLRMLRP